MRSSTSLRLRASAAVRWAAALALLFAAGCESMRDPDRQAMPWGPTHDWQYNSVPSVLTNP